MPRPKKRTKLLSDDESGHDDAGNKGFSINEEYARRFEHNKKREEKQKLEERHKAGLDDSDEESTSEEEDDDAELATADLDDEILTTLQAIKNKDPRVYDTNVQFYKEFDPEATVKVKVKEDKPMRLRDYHRENLLAGRTGGEDDDDEAPVRTYQQEQDDLKEDLLGSLQAAIQDDAEDDDGEGSADEDFLVAKSKPKHASLPAASRSRSAPKITDVEVAAADKDPDTYLSNFMAARAWLPGEESKFEAFDSDDSEDEARAEQYETAYNLRFEDPATANEKLQSFARDVGKYGVRRDEKSGRKQAREREQGKKGSAKREREEDRARLRKLKIDEVEEKVKKIKEAAGLKGQDIDLEQWRDIIEGDFEDDQWDQEMKQRFGDKYYQDGEAVESDLEMEDFDKKKKPVNVKPIWDDDINIKDLVPAFEDDDAQPNITLSDDEQETDGGVPLLDQAQEADANDSEADGAGKPSSKKAKKERDRAKTEAKREARQTRRKIEEMVDASLPVAAMDPPAAGVAGFRYRDTSPTSFGLTARDILFADDTQLNQYAGLKKMATWRDEERKRRDKKKFSKKGRLREWRKEVFGDVEGPKGVEGMEVNSAAVGEGGKKTKKRSRKRKAAAVEGS